MATTRFVQHTDNSSAGQHHDPSKERIHFYICSTTFPSGRIFHTALSSVSLSHSLRDLLRPPGLQVPPFPAATQASLAVLSPLIMYVQYPCAARCRSMGICVHFQFVLGPRRCPDGMICELCAVGVRVEEEGMSMEQEKEGRVEEVPVAASRKCPLHQLAFQSQAGGVPGGSASVYVNSVGSRIEDFLADDEQRRVGIEILKRSRENRWDGVEGKKGGWRGKDVVQREDDRGQDVHDDW